MSATLEFKHIAEDVIDDAVSVAKSVLRDEGTPGRLVDYYNRDTDYSGATFASLQPNPEAEITATDLLAVTTLSISFHNYAVRRFLEDGDNRTALSQALEALPVKSLEHVSDDEMQPMADLYEAVKNTLTRPWVKHPNPWVTASKIVARKRPGLFPVRDNVVCTGLGIFKLNYYLSDWRVFREIMKCEEIAGLLASLPDRIAGAAVDEAVDFEGETPLRLLDASLWMYFSEER